MKQKWFLRLLIFVCFAALVSAGCGGGGGGGSKSPDSTSQDQTDDNPPPDDNNQNPPPDQDSDDDAAPPPDDNNQNSPPDDNETSDGYKYKFVATGDMDVARCCHASTLLDSGDVLVTGGWNIGGFSSKAELYHPDTGIFETINDLPFLIGFHTATLLSDGRVFIYGMGAAIYDPVNKKFTSILREGSVKRIFHTATMLLNGKILITGGIDNSLGPVYLQSAILYDPVTGIYSNIGLMARPRAYHAAALLPDGRALIVGGAQGDSGKNGNDAEIFDPTTGKFTPAGTMLYARVSHTVTTLPNGKALIIGGTPYYEAELFDPVTNKFTIAGYLKTPRNNNHSATLLSNGKVLITGGLSMGKVIAAAEIYDSEKNIFSAVTPLLSPRYLHAAVLLQNGKVLITGGAATVNSNYLKSAELLE